MTLSARAGDLVRAQLLALQGTLLRFKRQQKATERLKAAQRREEKDLMAMLCQALWEQAIHWGCRRGEAGLGRASWKRGSVSGVQVDQKT